VTTAQVQTIGSATTTTVDKSVTGSNSGASAPTSSSLGCGTNSNASGNLATALGANSIGSGAGATALGANAVASADGAIAIGASQSTGVNSIAIGTGAVATGSVAVGAAATAANGGAAFGDGATATGLNATAVGPGASATFANSTAIGAGATATAPNQMAFGTASNTYVAPGITSAASKAAQSGPLQIVTSDAAGNLATNTPAGLGLASLTDINAINAQIGGINTRLNDLDGRTTKALNGVSMAFAIAGTPWCLAWRGLGNPPANERNGPKARAPASSTGRQTPVRAKASLRSIAFVTAIIRKHKRLPRTDPSRRIAVQHGQT